jgi:predicted RNase H-like nuclease (RuvC/YqgF family)
MFMTTTRTTPKDFFTAKGSRPVAKISEISENAFEEIKYMTEIERLKAEITQLEQVLKEKEENIERLFRGAKDSKDTRIS